MTTLKAMFIKGFFGGNKFPHLGQVNVGPWQAAECLKIISLISVSATKRAFLVKFSKI